LPERTAPRLDHDLRALSGLRRLIVKIEILLKIDISRYRTPAFDLGRSGRRCGGHRLRSDRRGLRFHDGDLVHRIKIIAERIVLGRLVK
jgi:hypothetical protein